MKLASVSLKKEIFFLKLRKLTDLFYCKVQNTMA